MTKVIFYEKPGCINNGKQKKLLLEAGHELEVNNLLTTPWTVETLYPFLKNVPLANWFNRTAPRIKSGEVVPENLDEAKALELMIEDPLLIRRPLIQVEDVYTVGFDQEKIDAWIGLKQSSPVVEDLESCPRSHQTTSSIS